MGLALDGLVSGLDTANTIDKLLQYETIPLYRYEEEKVEINEKKDVWRDINSRIDNLQKTLTSLKLSSTYNSNKAVSSDKEIITADGGNNAAEGVYDITIKSIAQIHRVGSTIKIDSQNLLKDELGVADISGDIQINGITVSVSTDETLTTLRDKINDTEDITVSASIVDGHLVLQSNETGVENAITLTDNGNGLLSELGITGDLTDINNNAVFQVATDAEIEINGITGITSSDNTFLDVVEGVTFNINKDSQINDTASVTVSKDTEKAVKTVQTFVDQYNSLVSFIDSKSYYDSEEEEGGILQGDSTLMRLEMRLRSLITDRTGSNSDYKHLGAVGITIDRDGVMSFDSDEFTEALEEAPEDVINLFNADADNDGFTGVASKLDSYIQQVIQTNTGVIPIRLEYYDKEVAKIDEDIETLEEKIESMRERYQSQFNAMEVALSQMQTQQSWMMSQLESLKNTSFSSLT